MTIQSFPFAKIYPNPYQRRRITPASVKELADSIRSHGLQKVPQARLHPEKKDSIQLVDGHRRLAAWKIVKPGEPFPVDMQSVTNREMFDRNIIENAQREDLSAIEMAIQIRDYMAEFKVSQEVVGKLFGLANQGSVSNKLALLRLPGEVQDLVSEGELPERLARPLITIAEVFPHDTVKIAGKVAAADPTDKESTLKGGISDLLDMKGRSMRMARWKLTWVPKYVPAHKSFKELPACEGCQFLIKSKGDMVGNAQCARPVCFDLKMQAWGWDHVADLAKPLGIAPGKPGEKVTVLNEQRDLERTRQQLKTKHESLRLIPAVAVADDWNAKYRRRELFGFQDAEHFQLATTDLTKLNAAIPKQAPAKADSRKQQMATWEARTREANARYKAVRQITNTAAAHIAPALKVVPESLIDIILGGRRFFNGKLVNTRTLPQKREALAFQLIYEYTDDRLLQKDAGRKLNCDHPDQLKVALGYLARRLKVKPLPEWQASTNGKTPTPAKKVVKPKGKKK
jgi:ParB/RepB/Spo0J family partition protein